MMQVALAAPPIMAFYGYCLLLCRKGYCRQDSAAFLVMSSMIVALFVSAWLGLLWTVTFTLIFIGVAVAIYEMKVRFSSPRVDVARREWLAQPILLHLIMVVALFAVLIINNAQLFFWDDFTHWAVVSKDVFARDAFPSPATGVSYFSDYPPGSALAQYFFLFPHKLYGQNSYSEQVAMWAQGIMIISSISMLLSHAFKRGLLYLVIIFVASLFAIFTYTDGFSTLMIDHVVGFYFAACVICIVLDENDNRWLLVAATGAVALSLLKLNAEFLSLVVIALALFNLFFRSARQNQDKTLRFYKAPSFQKGMLIIVVSVMLILAFKWTWKSHIETHGASYVFNTNISIEAAVSWILNPTENEAKISDKFIDAMMPGVESSFKETMKSVTNNPFKIAFIPVVLLSVLAVYIGGDRVRLGTLTAVLYAGFLSFCMGLLFFYQRSFDFSEAVRLASFGRYLSQYFLAIAFLAFALILHAWTPIKNIGLLVFSLLVAALFVLNPIPSIRIKEFVGVTTGNQEYISATRSKYSDFIKKHPFLRDHSTRIVLVWQCADGIESLLMSYDLYPAGVARIPNLGPECGSTGSVENGVFERFPFEKYDYLIIAQSNEWFWSAYAERIPLLEHDSRMRLYKITNESGHAIFTSQ